MPFSPPKKYIDEYDKLSNNDKDKLMDSKLADTKTFNAMLNLNHIRNLGFKEFYKDTLINNPILNNIFLLSVFIKIILWIYFYKIKFSNWFYIISKGFIPKKIYFSYVALKEYRDKN